MRVKILNEAEIRSCVGMNAEALEIVSEGFAKLALEQVTVPPIMRIDVHDNNGEVDIKTAYIHGLENFAIKIASGFLDNRALGLPTGSGMMVLISAKTGRPEAVLLDNGYLTDVRTGIAGAIAAKHLVPKNIRTAGVIGSGMQARYQIRGLKLVRQFREVLVFGIQKEQVGQYVQEMTQELGVPVKAAESAEQVVRESDMVVTTTPSRDPFLKAEWLHPGLHITCMGSDAEHKQELYPEVFAKADLIACDRVSQVFRLGELHHALEAGVVTDRTSVIELGEIITGKVSGRTDDQQITICDLTGVGVQDTQIARLAFKKAAKLGLGLEIDD
ncbi:MAG: cyclodeaminase [Anaerolineales bacterium]|jgi:ornithine cyclodeaminase